MSKASESGERDAPSEPAQGESGEPTPAGHVEAVAEARARRRAEEASRAAAAREAEARRIEHERDLAEVRRHLDVERARLTQQRREQERQRLAKEAADMAAELAALDEAESAQAHRDVQYQRQMEALEAERQRTQAEHRALAEAMQRELDEIDQRLEQRAQARSAVTPAPVALAVARVARKARLRVAASVMIDHAGTQVALPLVNVSRTGALFKLGGADLPTLRVGLALFITIFATEEVSRQVDLMARVVRIADGQAALDWSADAAAALDLARLLDDLSGR